MFYKMQQFIFGIFVIVICGLSSAMAQTTNANFSCSDRRFLSAAKAIFAGKEFRTRGVFDDGPHDCRELFDIRYVDLNRDGTPEILARGRTTPLCGGVGNCLFYVLRKDRRGYRVLLVATDYIDRSVMGHQVRKNRTRGYANILTTGHIIAGETSFSIARFNGTQYVESSCPSYEVYDRTVNGRPRFKVVSCKAFHSRLETP